MLNNLVCLKIDGYIMEEKVKKAKLFDTRKLVLSGLLTAIVIVLQALAVILPVYPFTLTLVLIPMVIGAALVNTYVGGWLGFVFGIVVLLSGNANLFLAVNPAATIIVVILKGVLAGLAAGAVYKIIAKKSKTIAAVAAAVVCPVVNTGIFIIGGYIFFLPTLTDWAESAGAANVDAYIFLGLVGINFLFELGSNIILSPVIVRLVQYGKYRRKYPIQKIP
jgi:uncharacterized membrane protein